MKVGVPTEIKTDEYRVSLTPAGVRELKEHGHDVLVQAGAGEGSTIADSEYEAQGARILPDAQAVFDEAELVLGVKEPQPRGGVAAQARAHAVHLPAPRARPRADQGPRGHRRHLHRVRDGGGRQGPPAAARADVGGGGQDRHAGRGVLPREADGRARRAARRRARRGGRHRARDRRRRGGPERGVHRDRHGGRRVRVRPQHRPPARARRGLRRARLHGVLVHARDRGDAAAWPTS